ncbi:MAG: NYN domain-containing protein [Dehalococcoidia bacterium]|nr:NYN domain-containing protein [Dehalococcoidia bacterium]
MEDIKDKVVIFIDGSNFYHALEQNCGRADVDFTRFAQRLAGERRIVRIYYYNVIQDVSRNPDGYREQQKFLTSLFDTPYLEVRLGTTRSREGVTVEKGVDVMLAVDLVSYGASHIYDTAIVVSGDADYAYAVQTVKNMGRLVELAAFESNASKDLLLVVDNRHFLDRNFFKDLWISGQASVASSRRRDEIHAPAPIPPKVDKPERPDNNGRPPRPQDRDRRGNRRRHPFRREPNSAAAQKAHTTEAEKELLRSDSAPDIVDPIIRADHSYREEMDDSHDD